jgi:hypothetical protein
MAVFHVTFLVTPGTRIEGNLDLTLANPPGRPPQRVFVHPLTSPDSDGAPYQVGLRVVVQTEAPSVDDAVLFAQGLADGVMAIISFIAGVGIPHAKSTSALQVDAGISERIFTEYFDLPIPQPSQSGAPSKALLRTLDGISGLDPPSQSRVVRAIQGLASGQREPEPIERFLKFWHGLEALNPLLERDLHARPEVRKCPKCQHEMQVPSTSGIRDFMDKNIDDGGNRYRRMRRLRVGLVHGVGGIDQSMVSEATILASVLRRALRLGICRYVGLQESDLRGKEELITNQLTSRGGVLCRLSPGNLEHYGPPGQDPHFDITHLVNSIRVRDDGSVDVEVNQTATARLAEGVTCKVDAFGFSGEWGGPKRKSAARP